MFFTAFSVSLVILLLEIQYYGNALPVECKWDGTKLCPALQANSSLPNCLSNGTDEACKARVNIFRVEFTSSDNLTSELDQPFNEIGQPCDTFYKVGISDLDLTNQSCPTTYTTAQSFLKLYLRHKLNDSTCQMNRQVYQYSENETECDVYLNKIRPFCFTLFYNCSDEGKVFKGNYSSVSFRPNEASKPWRREPLPLISHSKSNPHEQEHYEGHQHPTTHNSQKKEKHDSIKRTRKPHFGGWKEYILEIGLVAIVALTLLLIFVRICWAERDLLKHPRVVRFADDNSNSTTPRPSQTFSPSPRQSKSSTTSNGSSGPLLDLNRLPSKPILKNNTKPINQQPDPVKVNKPVRKPSMQNTTSSNNNPMKKSFDSINSIYYDALEGPESESTEPLISPVAEA